MSKAKKVSRGSPVRFAESAPRLAPSSASKITMAYAKAAEDYLGYFGSLPTTKPPSVNTSHGFVPVAVIIDLFPGSSAVIAAPRAGEMDLEPFGQAFIASCLRHVWREGAAGRAWKFQTSGEFEQVETAFWLEVLPTWEDTLQQLYEAAHRYETAHSLLGLVQKNLTEGSALLKLVVDACSEAGVAVDFRASLAMLAAAARAKGLDEDSIRQAVTPG